MSIKSADPEAGRSNGDPVKGCAMQCNNCAGTGLAFDRIMLAMRDGVRDLSHDHAELNRRVRAISARMQQQPSSIDSDTRTALVDLRELLFTHFAREEEGLFPFVAERAPAFAARVQEMAIAHDTICGALARACHLASVDERAQLAAVYERFEHTYAEHARSEGQLLAALDLQLDAKEREQLAALVEAL